MVLDWPQDALTLTSIRTVLPPIELVKQLR